MLVKLDTIVNIHFFKYYYPEHLDSSLLSILLYLQQYKVLVDGNIKMLLVIR